MTTTDDRPRTRAPLELVTAPELEPAEQADPTPSTPAWASPTPSGGVLYVNNVELGAITSATARYAPPADRDEGSIAIGGQVYARGQIEEIAEEFHDGVRTITITLREGVRPPGYLGRAMGALQEEIRRSPFWGCAIGTIDNCEAHRLQETSYDPAALEAQYTAARAQLVEEARRLNERFFERFSEWPRFTSRGRRDQPAAEAVAEEAATPARNRAERRSRKHGKRAHGGRHDWERHRD